MGVGRGAAPPAPQPALTGLLGQAQAPGWLESPGSGMAEGSGGRTVMPPEASGPPPPPRPGRDRSLLLRPHYRGERPGLAEEPDGCRGRWGGLPAPWPGLNIYYVLFGLWGRGRRAVASIPSCRRGGAGPGGGGWAQTRRPAPQPPWAGRVGTPGPPSTPPPVDPSRGGDLLPSRWAAVTDLGYREGAAGGPGNASHPEDA